MATLLSIPKVSQLTTVTDEKGEISNNAQQDCTAAGVDLLCRYVLGTPENSIFNPDNMKDHAYGDAYVGGTAALEYVAYCQSLGVHLYPVDASSYASLVALAHHFIRDLKQPCVFTRDDPYVDQRVHPDWTHVSVFYGEDDAGLTAHDPYIDAPVYKTDQGWIDVLKSAQLWLAEKIAPAAKPEPIPAGWTDDGTTLTAPNGVHVVLGFREWILSHSWQPEDYPLEAERALPSLEDSNPSLGAGSQQIFRFSMLGYTKERGVFAEWPGQELLYLRARYAAIYGEYSKLVAWYDSFKSAYVAGQVQPS